MSGLDLPHRGLDSWQSSYRPPTKVVVFYRRSDDFSDFAPEPQTGFDRHDEDRGLGFGKTYDEDAMGINARQAKSLGAIAPNEDRLWNLGGRSTQPSSSRIHKRSHNIARKAIAAVQGEGKIPTNPVRRQTPGSLLIAPVLGSPASLWRVGHPGLSQKASPNKLAEQSLVPGRALYAISHHPT